MRLCNPSITIRRGEIFNALGEFRTSESGVNAKTCFPPHEFRLLESFLIFFLPPALGKVLRIIVKLESTFFDLTGPLLFDKQFTGMIAPCMAESIAKSKRLHAYSRDLMHAAPKE